MNRLDQLLKYFDSLIELEKLRPNSVPNQLFFSMSNEITQTLYPQQEQIKEENE